MYYVYVLQSDQDENLYIGSTNDLRRRLAEHQAGKSPSTAPRRPFRLVNYEAYADESDARERERRLKLRGEARRHMKGRIQASLQSKK